MKAISLTTGEVLRLRMRSQRLAERTEGSPEAALGAVFAVQAQELPAARLALRARSKGLTAAQVDEARQKRRTIVWTWAMRGTLHLVTAEDAAWLAPLLGPGLIAGDERRLGQLGWDEDRLAQGEALVDGLLDGEAQTRTEIAGALAEAGLPSEGQAPVHLLFRLAAQGRIVRAADRDGQPAYALREDWLGAARPLPREEALARLARGYLAAYAPASAAGLAAWAGLPLGEARQALASIQGELAEVSMAGEPGWMLQEQAAWPDEPPEEGPVRLLPRFDAYLLGYDSRSLALPKEHARKVHPGGGMLLASVLAGGRIAGTWAMKKRGKVQEITVEPFEPLPGWVQPALEAEAEDIGRFLGVETRWKR